MSGTKDATQRTLERQAGGCHQHPTHHCLLVTQTTETELSKPKEKLSNVITDQEIDPEMMIKN